MQSKFFGKSITIWGLIIMLIIAALQHFGVTIGDGDEETITSIVYLIGEVISGIMILVGRWGAKKPLTASLAPKNGSEDHRTSECEHPLERGGFRVFCGKCDRPNTAPILILAIVAAMLASSAMTGCAKTETNRVAQSVIATKAAADQAIILHNAGVTTPAQERVILDLLQTAALAEDAYYNAIRAGDGAAMARAKAAWAAASQRLTTELAKYPRPTPPIHIPPATQPR